MLQYRVVFILQKTAAAGLMTNRILGMAVQNAVWLVIWSIKLPGLYYALYVGKKHLD